MVNVSTNRCVAQMWCDLWKTATYPKRWNCKIKEINIIILMFFFSFYGFWTSVTLDTSIRGDSSKKFWKENNSNFHMISITQKHQFCTMWQVFSYHITNGCSSNHVVTSTCICHILQTVQLIIFCLGTSGFYKYMSVKKLPTIAKLTPNLYLYPFLNANNYTFFN